MPNKTGLPKDPKPHFNEENKTPPKRKSSPSSLKKVKKLIKEAGDIKEHYDSVLRSTETSKDKPKLSIA